MKTMKKVLAVLMCLSCAVLFVMFFQKAFVVESPLTDPVYVRPLSSIFGYVWKNPVMEKSEMLLGGAPWMVLMGIIPMSLLIIWVNRMNSVKKDLWMHIITLAAAAGDFVLAGTLKSGASDIADLLFGEVAQTGIGYTFTSVILIVMSVLTVLHGVVSIAVKNGSETENNAVSKTGKSKKSPVRTLVTTLAVIFIVLLTILGLIGGAITLVTNAQPSRRQYTPEQQSYLAMQHQEGK